MMFVKALTIGGAVLMALLLVVASATAESRTFSWTPSAGAVSHRLYRAAGTGAWKLVAQAATPRFVVEVGRRPALEPLAANHTHWMAVDVMGDGTEVPQQDFGWWTRP